MRGEVWMGYVALVISIRNVVHSLLLMWCCRLLIVEDCCGCSLCAVWHWHKHFESLVWRGGCGMLMFGL